jgi:hypothetical protein
MGPHPSSYIKVTSRGGAKTAYYRPMDTSFEAKRGCWSRLPPRWRAKYDACCGTRAMRCVRKTVRLIVKPFILLARIVRKLINIVIKACGKAIKIAIKQKHKAKILLSMFQVMGLTLALALTNTHT